MLDNTNGLLLYGYQAGATAFQGGFMCIAAPRRRTSLQNSGAAGAGSPCAGQFSFDLGGLVLSGADPLLQVAGQTFACQYWSRDSADPFASSLSDAVHGQICW